MWPQIVHRYFIPQPQTEYFASHLRNAAESPPARTPLRLIHLNNQIHSEVFQSFMKNHFLAKMFRFVAIHLSLVDLP